MFLIFFIFSFDPRNKAAFNNTTHFDLYTKTLSCPSEYREDSDGQH